LRAVFLRLRRAATPFPNSQWNAGRNRSARDYERAGLARH
jgi:hypothetical protein